MDTVKVESKSGYSIVTMLTDKLDGTTVPTLRSELVLLAGSSVKNMIIDLSTCEYCDTTGLSAILIAHRLCKDGTLILAGVRESVENMLSIQRFDPPLILVGDMAEGEARMKLVLEA